MNETPKRCRTHGGKLDDQGWCPTVKVLLEVERERKMQFAKYGTNEDLEDGTGGQWAWPVSASSANGLEERFRVDYDKHEARHGRPTWMHLVREEVAEAFQETTAERLREELIQVAALCVSWVEKIDTRGQIDEGGLF